MRLGQGVKQFFCWFFISTLLLTTLQVTVAGFEADENSLFRILTTTLAEEENEDSEKEEESKSSKEFASGPAHIAFVDSNKYFRSLEGHQLYFSVIREVLSPPPEA